MRGGYIAFVDFPELLNCLIHYIRSSCMVCNELTFSSRLSLTFVKVNIKGKNKDSEDIKVE